MSAVPTALLRAPESARSRFGCAMALALGLAASPPTPAQAVTDAQRDAARLLTQATFGPTLPEIGRAAAIGPATWIDQQIAAPATLHLEATDAHYRAMLPLYNLGRATPETSCIQSLVCRYARRDTWWRVSITAPDQLRQRTAFALSQFFVVSDLNADVAYTQYAPADFYDTLVVNAFGDFRTLLEEVTLHPAMGRYLGMLQNEKADPARNTEPDENYAREVMQLFTVGLTELNPDGTPRTAPDGSLMPTYGDPEITDFARVFTGWNYANATRWSFGRGAAGIPGHIEAMRANEAYHDTGAKTLLRGQRLAAGRAAAIDLDDALDNLANHPNVGPFLARHLIQRLVTSNPSPAYVGRVAAVFADNGRGQRGDLAAVVRAVLLDAEARDPTIAAGADYGKLREPLLRYTALWRAFGAQGVSVSNSAGSVGGIFRFYSSDSLLAQAPLSAPSVFNFYRPNYRKPGEIRDRGLFSPEFQIVNDNTAIAMANRLHGALFNSDRDVTSGRTLANTIAALGNLPLDFSVEKSLATQPDALVDRLDLLMMAGRMSPPMRAVLVDAIGRMPATDGGRQRVEDAVFLVASSPQFSVQR